MPADEDALAVVEPEPAERAEQMPFVDPAAPAVGKWYWVAGKRWLT